VRMGIMMGPMIPGLNEHEMQRIMKAAKEKWRHLYRIYFYTAKWCNKIFYSAIGYTKIFPTAQIKYGI